MASLVTNNNNNNNEDESKGGDDDSNDIEFLCERTDSLEIEIQATGKRGEIAKKEILRAINNSNNNHNAGDGKNNYEINIVDQSFIDILPGGGAGRDVVCTILTMLDMKSLSSLIYSSFIQLFCKSQNDFTLYQLCTNIQYPYKIQFMDNLKQKYKKEFPKGTPIVVMCEKGRLEDLKLFLKLFVACHDVDGTGVSVKKLLEEVGKNSYGNEMNTLIASAYGERPEVLVQLLKYDVNTAITNNIGNALHYSAGGNNKSTRCIESLLKKMSLESINKIWQFQGMTPLDCAYDYNEGPIKNDIVQLIRQHGGKANCYDRNGVNVGKGKGDLFQFLLDTSLGGATNNNNNNNNEDESKGGDDDSNDIRS